MSARKAMEERIFAAIEAEGPLPREVLAERATKDGDTKRAFRIIRDLIEQEILVVLSPRDRVDLHPDQKLPPLAKMIKRACKQGASGEDR